MVKVARKLIAACFLIPCAIAFGQTPISGTVNSYYSVTGVSCSANEVTVSSVAGLSVGDKVIIMQMTGVQMDQSNTASFGLVTDYQYAGNYEVLTIDAISGTTIHFQYQILRDYDPATGVVQLIRMPVYTNASVVAQITCPAWNGSTGGVIAIECSGTLTLSSSGPVIVADGLGFQGSTVVQNNATGCGSNWPNYYYPNTAAGRGAPKGQGIAAFIANKEGGKGPQATGGGGGNDHNAGGGGGAQYGAGGNGGVRECPPTAGGFCPGGVSTGNHPGIGGYSVSSLIDNTDNRIFLGGAGGAGHDNNTNAGCEAIQSKGGNGGGIIIIRANTFDFGANQDVSAIGTKPPLAACDGSGGGGAGGIMLLDVTTFVNPKRLFTNGAKGGDNYAGASCAAGSPTCMGPGGGGGGGVLWFKGTPAIGGSDLADVTGGLKGDQNNAGCGGGTATAGGAGVILNNLVITESSTSPNACALPVELDYFHGKQVKEKIELTWFSALEINCDRYEVQRAAEEGAFATVAEVKSSGSKSSYDITDSDPAEGMNLYRLKQIDLDGRFTYSDQVAVNYAPGQSLLKSIYPNPLESGTELTFILFNREAGDISFRVMDILGKPVCIEEKYFESGKAVHVLQRTCWPEGVYFVTVSAAGQTVSSRIIVAK